MEEASGIAGATAVAERPDASAPSHPTGRRRTRISLQALLLLGIYALLTLACDPRGTLGTDTGAKVATLEVMNDRGSIVPDVGYWAGAQDPNRDVHPLLYTTKVGEHFVQVTTLPMIIAAYPLYAVGGYRLALLLPMLGAIGCACAARGLARRLGAGDPDLAFWLVGLASPVAIYALDLWEHAPGLALMLFGVLKLFDASQADGRVRDALCGGLLFGLATSMRTEAFVYGAVTGAVVFGVQLWTTRDIKVVLTRGIAAVVGAVAMVVANVVLEIAVLGDPIRAGRAAATAGSSGSDVGLRLKEALITTTGVNLGDITWDVTSAALMLAFVYFARRAVKEGWSDRAVIRVMALLGVLVVFRWAAAPAFVSGFLMAFPMALLAFVVGPRLPRAKVIMGVALAALPVAWATEYVGGAGPQWGGRYVLTSSILLGVVGFVAAVEYAPLFAKATAVLCIAITALGIVYLSQRSHDVGRIGERVAALDSDVVIGRDGFFLRELGVQYDERRQWLTAWNDDLLKEALVVAHKRGANTLAVMSPNATVAHAKLAGWREVKSAEWPVFFGKLFVSEYEKTG